jgi:hypothetical protein
MGGGGTLAVGSALVAAAIPDGPEVQLLTPSVP